jgi:hypothetical protein
VIGYVGAGCANRSEAFLQQDLDTNLVQPGYGLLDPRAAVETEGGHWELVFCVQNATNENYGAVGFDVPIVNGFSTINGLPRTLLDTIRYRSRGGRPCTG